MHQGANRDRGGSESAVGIDGESMRLRCFEQQCDELELLAAVYCNPGELSLHDQSVPVQMRRSIDRRHVCEDLQARIEFTVTVRVFDGRLSGRDSREIKMELVFSLPHSYPMDKPVVFMRCPDLARRESFEFNRRLQEFILSLPSGTVAVMDIIDWVKDNSEKWLIGTECRDFTSSIDVLTSEVGAGTQQRFERLWLYSHHIYSSFKRRDIVAWARDLQLTGFSMPGKPGVICAEGVTEDIDEYVQRLRSHSWKKLTIKERQAIGCFLQPARKFSDFKEITFSSDGHTRDLREFLNYLQERDLGGIFKILFGIDGQ